MRHKTTIDETSKDYKVKAGLAAFTCDKGDYSMSGKNFSAGLVKGAHGRNNDISVTFDTKLGMLLLCFKFN